MAATRKQDALYAAARALDTLKEAITEYGSDAQKTQAIQREAQEKVAAAEKLGVTKAQIGQVAQ